MNERPRVLATLAAASLLAACSSVEPVAATVAELQGIEESRLRALVGADVATARALHADDFQLITPFGAAIGKEAYLGGIASGAIDYHVWQPGPMEVRLFPGAAVVRYRAEVEITFRGQRLPRQRLWHTDLYERRGGRWRIVWSQATEIRDP